MAVYLEVVPQGPVRAQGGTQTLQGADCMVFYLGGIPASGSSHPGGVNIMFGDGSVRMGKDLDAIAAELSRTPRTASTIILGPSTQTGYVTTRWELSPRSSQAPSLGLTTGGGAAVLIGLLLPAVQVARQAARSKTRPPAAIQALKSVAGPSGHVFVIDADGSLMPL